MRGIESQSIRKKASMEEENWYSVEKDSGRIDTRIWMGLYSSSREREV